MKFAIVLLCAVAAVQGRSTSVQVADNQRSVAALGENPWVLHLRLAVSTSGFLESCAGALIDRRWALTSAYCVRQSTFIWVRFGAVQKIRPQLVLEVSAVTPNSEWDPITGANNVALINLNRDVELTENIAVIPLPAASSDIGDSVNYCAYGETEDNTAGEWLHCWDVSVQAINNEAVIVAGEGIAATQYDSGAPLASDGVLVGILNHASESNPEEVVFTRTSAQVNWISGMTGISFGRAAPARAPAPEGIEVNFVN